MSGLLSYKDTATFYQVQSGRYSADKTIVAQADVPVIFLQNIGFNRSASQEVVTSDAICYPDPENAFIVDNFNRLEGFYILAPLYGVGDDEAWYKVETVRVNRDHLLNNEIDNIQLLINKTKKLTIDVS